MEKIFTKLESLSNDAVTILVTIAVAIVGWAIALFLQNRNIKEQHRVQVRYDIYNQFVESHKLASGSLSKLYASMNPPFNLMQACMIPYNIGLRKKYKDVWIKYSEHECLYEGSEKWREYIQGCFDLYFKYQKEYQQFQSILEDWEATVVPLIEAKETLETENKKVSDNTYKILQYLRDLPSQEDRDWRKWSENDIQKMTMQVQEEILTINFYIGDFMVLVHNELLASYFKHKRPTRKTLDPSYKVLTKKGLVVSLDYEKIQKKRQARISIIQDKFTKILTKKLDKM